MIKEGSALSSTAHSQRELQILHLLWLALVEHRVTWTIWGGKKICWNPSTLSLPATWAAQPVGWGFIKASFRHYFLFWLWNTTDIDNIVWSDRYTVASLFTYWVLKAKDSERERGIQEKLHTEAVCVWHYQTFSHVGDVLPRLCREMDYFCVCTAFMGIHLWVCLQLMQMCAFRLVQFRCDHKPICTCERWIQVDQTIRFLPCLFFMLTLIRAATLPGNEPPCHFIAVPQSFCQKQHRQHSEAWLFLPNADHSRQITQQPGHF